MCLNEWPEGNIPSTGLSPWRSLSGNGVRPPHRGIHGLDQGISFSLGAIEPCSHPGIPRKACLTFSMPRILYNQIYETKCFLQRMLSGCRISCWKEQSWPGPKPKN